MFSFPSSSLFDDPCMDLLNGPFRVLLSTRPSSSNSQMHTRSNRALEQDMFRVCLKAPGFNEQDITHSLQNGKLVITGKHRDGDNDDNFFQMEFRKTIDLPAKVETDKLRATWCQGDRLLIEAPRKRLIESAAMVDEPGVGKLFRPTLDLSSFTPKDISVKLLADGRTVRVSAKRESGADSVYSLSEYVREVVLPDGAEADQLKTKLAPDGLLNFEVPMKAVEPAPTERIIPIMRVDETVKVEGRAAASAAEHSKSKGDQSRPPVTIIQMKVTSNPNESKSL